MAINSSIAFIYPDTYIWMRIIYCVALLHIFKVIQNGNLLFVLPLKKNSDASLQSKQMMIVMIVMINRNSRHTSETHDRLTIYLVDRTRVNLRVREVNRFNRARAMSWVLVHLWEPRWSDQCSRRVAKSLPIDRTCLMKSVRFEERKITTTLSKVVWWRQERKKVPKRGWHNKLPHNLFSSGFRSVNLCLWRYT